MVEVFVDRLVEVSEINEKRIWAWPGIESISLEDIRAEKSKGMQGNSEPYGDTWKHPVTMQRDRDYHISRAIYFIDHPEEINGIEVDNLCTKYGILPRCVIIDGWHRIAAAIILNLEKITIDYGGRIDVLDYICGKTEKYPDETFPIY